MLLCAAATYAADPGGIPRAFHAKTYPANDAHTNEQFAVAADPYDLPDKAGAAFTVNYLREGLLPIHVIFSNDSEKAVSLARVSVRFITRTKVKISPALPQDVFRRIAKQVKRGDEPKIVNLPIPVKRKKRSISQDAQEEVELLSSYPRAVEPKSTQSGVYIFDVQGLDHPLAGGKLVVTGVQRDGEELFFFEIPMEKYLSYDPNAQPK